MNRRRTPSCAPRLPLHQLLQRAQLFSLLPAIGLTFLSLTVTGLLALSSYAEHNLQLLARSLSYTLEAAVVFNDRAAAHESLEQIATASEEIAEARVLDRNGKLLADWSNPDDRPARHIERSVANLLMQQPLTLPITHQGKVIGELQLSSQGSALTRFLGNGLLSLLACLLLSILITLYGSRRMRKAIMTPLRRLSEVAHAISRDRTFEQRVPTSRILELDELAGDFNSLLDELETWQNHLQRENASLSHLASHDALTGLPNRALFETTLARTLRESLAKDHKCAVLFIDCNRFKEINDNLGHSAGDAVLVGIAKRLRLQLRAGDLVARLGGDEFAILLKTVHDAHDALDVADKILESLQQPLPLPDDRQLMASLSIGVALCPEHASDPQTLIHTADLAMYHAKQHRSGRHLAPPRRHGQH
ncbi:diguanylate cyclase domain-containing protein [Stutzerimonas kirkiae]|uniref:Diguanylate cyclase n=1 Tax=Stutzerimonas kirkiae TaxID=2211392 RepID=A0A4Q9R2M2_9GAMM|nr:diguanylate cyclase [Stutzerimonas kirkiae]TBU92008.1 diguanylate cyclase [Stutzerimonas kirkiae]TBU99441.1 diguanylate cyclase [Stutzerimonas kirkiae]TBV05569.1 diguanylate cyclase [Stutzerimonas kirkiae]TBV10692.1 diguanylate cyclase [Stutzerimonas kirkiae]